MSSTTFELEQKHSAQVLADRLLGEFGCPFCILQQSDSDHYPLASWELVSGETSCLDLSKLPSETVNEPWFLPSNDQIGRRLAIPFNSAGERFLAVSIDSITWSEEDLRLAGLVSENLRLQQRVAEQEIEADQFAVQVSRDFEELTFLQRMMESLDVASADAQLSDVATSILRQLRPAIEARSLLFISAAETDPRYICVGEAIDLDWFALLRIGQHDYSAGPLVRNRIEDERFPGVGQFVSAEISNRTQPFGWLVAVNRVPSLFCNLDGTKSEAEFGTYEASLLSSATSVMAAYGLNRELLTRKEKLLIDVVRCLVSAIDAKDDYTRGHSIRVAQFARRLATELGWTDERCEKLYMAGLLHDVGKIGVPDEVLKKPGALEADERELIRRHPDYGWTILHQLEELQHVLPGVVHHHEDFDGSGYPDQIAGHEIPVEARVIAVADAYDAMVSDRAYRKGRSHDQALKILREGSGVQWDPEVVAAFESVASQIDQLAKDYRHAPSPQRKPTDDHTAS